MDDKKVIDKVILYDLVSKVMDIKHQCKDQDTISKLDELIKFIENDIISRNDMLNVVKRVLYIRMKHSKCCVENKKYYDLYQDLKLNKVSADEVIKQLECNTTDC